MCCRQLLPILPSSLGTNPPVVTSFNSLYNLQRHAPAHSERDFTVTIATVRKVREGRRNTAITARTRRILVQLDDRSCISWLTNADVSCREQRAALTITIGVLVEARGVFCTGPGYLHSTDYIFPLNRVCSSKTLPMGRTNPSAWM